MARNHASARSINDRASFFASGRISSQRALDLLRAVEQQEHPTCSASGESFFAAARHQLLAGGATKFYALRRHSRLAPNASRQGGPSAVS